MRWQFYLTLLGLVLIPSLGKGEQHLRQMAESTMEFDANAEISIMTQETAYSRMVLCVKRWQALPLSDRLSILDGLVSRLTDTSLTPVSDPEDMVVFSRIKSGKTDIPGVVLSHDVYIAGGRMAWAVERLLRIKGLPRITEEQRQDDRLAATRQITIAVSAYKHGILDAIAEAEKGSGKIEIPPVKSTVLPGQTVQ